MSRAKLHTPAIRSTENFAIDVMFSDLLKMRAIVGRGLRFLIYSVNVMFIDLVLCINIVVEETFKNVYI